MALDSTKSEALPAGYESTVITKIDMTDEELGKFREKVTSIVNQFKGDMVLTEDWGRRKMGYPINKEQRGNYTHFVFGGTPGVVAELERNYRISDKVIRFLTVQQQKEFDKPSLLKDHFQFSKATAPKVEDRPDREERPERGRGRGGYRGRD